MQNLKFKILVLDGGGSKGVYTLGALKELELSLGEPLYKHFDLIYGTSTGSIIGSLLGLGKSVDDIIELYNKNIPTIMSKRSNISKSYALKELCDQYFNNLQFEDFKTDVGIVALNFDTQQPFIFKSNVKQAHGMLHSFIPGFGCSISDAIQSSCSAYPIFNKKIVQTKNYGTITAVDGGYIANNSTLFAIIDADRAFKVPLDSINVLSIGTGSFIESPMPGIINYLKKFKLFNFIEKILSASTNTNVQLAKLLYPKIKIVRLNKSYNDPKFKTNMVEKDKKKLEWIFQLGRKCFADNENDVKDLFS